jgi:predicted MFS family arabinose efflux permease
MRHLPFPSAAKLLVAWLTMFMVGTELFVFSPLLPILAADYEVPIAVAGLSVTVFSLTYMVSAPVFGRLSDRIGQRRVLTRALLAFAVANLLTGSATSLPALLIARLLSGAAAAGISPSVYALIGSAAPPAQRATWMALVVSGLLVSLALGASTGALVAPVLGWQAVFVAIAFLSLILAALNRRVWPADSSGTPVSETANHPSSARNLLHRLLPTVLWSTGLYAVYTYLGSGLLSAGFSTGRAAQAIGCYGCGAIGGVFIGGYLADRAGVKFTGGASFAGLFACFLLLALALDAGSLVEPVLGLTAAVAQLFFPAQQAGLVNDFPSRRATALAWNSSSLFLGISLGSLIGGGALSLGGFRANLATAAGIALIGCAVNAAAVPPRQTLSSKPPKSPDDDSLTPAGRSADEALLPYCRQRWAPRTGRI